MSYQDTILKKIRQIATAENWIELDHQENIKMISFTNAVDRVNVYYSKMTVATCIEHPKKGKTQLFRKRVSFQELIEIFKAPRVHTGKGYYKK